MFLRLRKSVLLLICLGGVVGISATTTDAGVIPWVYDAIFGPTRAYYGPAYAPMATTSMYGPRISPCGPCAPRMRGPRMSFFCPPACCLPCCNPCDPCGPCGLSSASGGCPDGSCGLASAASSSSSAEPKPIPKTFAEKAEVPEPKVTDNSSIDDEGFRARATGEGETGSAIDAFKQPETIRQKQPAPMGDFKETATESDGETEEASEETESDQSDVSDMPPFSMKSLEQKITWRVTPVRTRASMHARFVLPTVTRAVPSHNNDWKPVKEDTRVAKN